MNKRYLALGCLLAPSLALAECPSAPAYEHWLCLGRTQSSQAAYSEAITAFQQAQQLAEGHKQQLQAGILLGDAQRATHAADAARNTYDALYTLANKHHYQGFVFAITLRLGHLEADAEHWQAALAQYQAAYRLAANDNERAASHAQIALALRHLKQWDQAVSHQIKVVILQEKAGDSDQYLEASLTLADLYRLTQAFDQSRLTLERLLKMIQEAGGHPDWEARIKVLLATVQRAQQQSAADRLTLEQALALAKLAKNATLEQEINRLLENP